MLLWLLQAETCGGYSIYSNAHTWPIPRYSLSLLFSRVYGVYSVYSVSRHPSPVTHQSTNSSLLQVNEESVYLTAGAGASLIIFEYSVPNTQFYQFSVSNHLCYVFFISFPSQNYFFTHIFFVSNHPLPSPSCACRYRGYSDVTSERLF